MSAERGCFGLRNGNQPQEPGKSASKLLQSYIERFDRTVDSVDEGHRAAGPPQPMTPSAGAGAATAAASRGFVWEKPEHLVQLPPELPPMDDDRDTLELLCGGQTAAGGVHVSVKTRRILRDAERQLGNWQPSYSMPEKLDLRTLWPSMHEHLERRWRQQLRARYEARQRQQAEAAAAAAAVQSLRADLYSSSSSNRRDYQRRRTCSSRTVRQQSLQAAPRKLAPQPKPDDSEEACDTSGPEKAAAADSADSGDDEAPGAFGGSLAEAAANSSESEDDDDDEERDDELGGGGPWGSDSGLGLSFRDRRRRPTDELALGKEGRDHRKTATALRADPGADADDDNEFADHRSFEERMRSYRFVLEAHELSAQLRQRLEVACSAVGSTRALTAEQKGRIRDRLTRLQHQGLLTEPSESLQQPPTGAAQPPQPSQPAEQHQRISTERLTRLMSSARGLLAENNCRLTSCSRLCDSLSAAATAAAAASTEQNQKQQLQLNTTSIKLVQEVP